MWAKSLLIPKVTGSTYVYKHDNNDNDKVFYSTLIIHFILHITVINAFGMEDPLSFM